MSPLDAALELLPKVELHCHLEGTMRPATVAELAAKNGIPLPVPDPVELYHYSDLTGFLEIFWLVQSVLVTREDWALLAYESVVDGAAHGLAYREAFVTPARHLADGHDLALILAGIDDGLAAAERETGAVCRLIVDLDRAFGPAAGLELVERVLELRRVGAQGADRILGIGMDSTELGIDPRSYAPAYHLAGAAGLRRTAHQGENSEAWAIAAALDVLGCERIDHGISVFGNPDLVSRVVDERIPFTVCPLANVRINPDRFGSIDDHVFPQMRAAGILATLNTDDPGLTRGDLGEEYRSAAAVFGYGWDDLVAIGLDAVEASWLDQTDKASLRSRVAAAAVAVRPNA